MRPSSEFPRDEAARVQQWLARDPERPRRRRVEEWARFDVLRARLLRHLVRDPWMWGLQATNVLGGLARYALCLGVFLVLVPPILAFWEAVLWPADPAAVAPDGILGRWLQLGLLWLVGLIVGDIVLLGCRLSRFRNLFVDKAERLAWAVVDAETPAAGGTAPRRPGTPDSNTQSPREPEERARC